MKPCLSAQSVGLKAFFKFTVCGNRSGGEELSGFKTLLIIPGNVVFSPTH